MVSVCLIDFRINQWNKRDTNGGFYSGHYQSDSEDLHLIAVTIDQRNESSLQLNLAKLKELAKDEPSPE